jgi:hypothetical protein
MRKLEVRKILNTKYCAYRDEVIAIVKSLSPESRLSGDDSGLEDVWEEFKYQAQREESFAFDLYVETIESFCKAVIEKLPGHELEFLWLNCDMYFDHDDDSGPPTREELIEGVASELYRTILEVANDEELKFDPDEEREVQAFQDDLGLFREAHDEPRG